MNSPENLSPEDATRLQEELKLPIGEKIAVLIKTTEMTMTDLAKTIGMPLSTMKKIKRRGTAGRDVITVMDGYVISTAVYRYIIERAKQGLSDALEKPIR